MEFEIFKTKSGKRYYVYPEGTSWDKASYDLARQKKTRADIYKCITVWITRAEDTGGDWDYLYLDEVKGAKQMLAAVRKKI